MELVTRERASEDEFLMEARCALRNRLGNVDAELRSKDLGINRH
jgi:hypothetical protein